MTRATAPAPSTSASSTPPEPSLLERYRVRYPWLDHLVRAGVRYTEKHGTHYAAAITYFSILALVPLIMIAFAVVAIVLAGNPALLDQLRTSITDAVPAGLDSVVQPVIDQAIASRNTVGVIGLVGALYTGLSWMYQLREALSEQWDQHAVRPNIVRMYVGDFFAMIGLGVALVASFAITAAGSGLSGVVLEFLGFSEVGWARVLFTIAGIVVTLLADWLVFLWVLSRLPRDPVTLRSAARAAVLAAVGFVVLQQVGTFYLATVTNSPTGATFGPIIGLLVFANLVSQFILFVTAWAATMRENRVEAIAEPAPVIVRPAVTVSRRPRAATAAGLVGAGAVLGAVGGLLGRRRD